MKRPCVTELCLRVSVLRNTSMLSTLSKFGQGPEEVHLLLAGNVKLRLSLPGPDCLLSRVFSCICNWIQPVTQRVPFGR